MSLLDIFRISKIKTENEQLQQQVTEMQATMDSIGITEYVQAAEKIRSERATFDSYVESKNAQLEADIKASETKIRIQLENGNKEISENNDTIARLREEITSLSEKCGKLDKQVQTQTRKLSRSKELYLSVDHAIQNFFESDTSYMNCKLSARDFTDYDLISPSVILKLHSFGENVFKVGMTRRLNPQDRIDELGNASVPFKFDVHSFIFSDDAVGLENRLHTILDQKRVNKVNMRKEFFNVSIDELERIVTDIDPTAEFNRTMVAEEYRQSLSADENYSSNYVPYDSDDNEYEDD